jgi:hypothetical protein
MPNNQFQRSVNSRLRRLSPPAELERSASWIVARNVSAKMAARDPSP